MHKVDVLLSYIFQPIHAGAVDQQPMAFALGLCENCYKTGVFAAFTVAVLQERCKLLYRLIC